MEPPGNNESLYNEDPGIKNDIVHPNNSKTSALGRAINDIFCCLSFQVIFIWFCVDWGGISYNDVKYPGWAEFLGWMLCISAMMCVPGYAIYRYMILPDGTPYEVNTQYHDQLINIFDC